MCEVFIETIVFGEGEKWMTRQGRVEENEIGGREEA